MLFFLLEALVPGEDYYRFTASVVVHIFGKLSCLLVSVIWAERARLKTRECPTRS